MLKPVRKKLFFSSLFVILFSSLVHSDKPTPWQIWYQEPASPVMERIAEMHTYLLYIICAIAVLVTTLLLVTIYRFRESKNKIPSKIAHNTFLEILWTLIPLIIVCAIAIPSIKLIFFMDKTNDAEITLKVIGHQWYWEYDYPDHKISFDSYMLEEEQLKPEQLRNLEVDKQVILPIDTNVRILATSADVLHSWAVPAFGIKQDTIPGRLRETWVRIKKPGVYYGQCSELCGLNHGFMSIAVKAVPKAEFEAWVRQEGGEIPAPEIEGVPAEASTQIIADPQAVPPAPNADLEAPIIHSNKNTQ